MSQSNLGLAAGAVFDRLAPTYDLVFTDSRIGRAQRSAVWQVLLRTFHATAVPAKMLSFLHRTASRSSRATPLSR